MCIAQGVKKATLNVDVVHTENKLTFTVTSSGDDSFYFGQHIWINVNKVNGTKEITITDATFNGDTYYVGYNYLNNKLVAKQIKSTYEPNVIIIWVGTVTGDYKVNVFFDATTMANNRLDTRTSAVEEKVSELEAKTSASYKTANILAKVVCCGDSYTSGYIATDTGTIETNENYAWPKYMSKLTGNEWINCGSAGANVLTWQTASRGLPKAKTSGKPVAYIIGLGLNDTSASSRHVDLGTNSDIGTDAKTYYGGYSKIIRELHTIAPDAYIFCQTMPNPNIVKTEYNQAIADIVKQYANEYHTKLIDLTRYNAKYNKRIVSQNVPSGGHYAAAGYYDLAVILEDAISDYINEHPTEFMDINKIAYDK